MWDGTQEVPLLNPDEILDSLTDDLMNFGDLQHAMRNLMQRGMQNPDGDRTQGLRDLLQKLRQQRREQLDKFNLSSIFDDIQRQLDEIVEMERGTIDQRLKDAGVSLDPPPSAEDDQGADGEAGAPHGGQPQSGEQQPSSSQGAKQAGDEDGEFAEMLRKIARGKTNHLYELPEDAAGQMKHLQNYEFLDPEAQTKFNELLDSLKQAMMDKFFNNMQQQLANMSPEELERMKNMAQDLNKMLQEKMAGDEPDFDGFMEKYGDMFGDNPPQSLEELIAQMQQQMGQMQSLMDSLPGDMQQQLQDLLADKLGDPGLQQTLNELAQNLEYLSPTRDMSNQYPFRGDEELDLQAAMELMKQMQSIDELERQLERTQYGGEIDEIDADKLEELLGPEARDTLDELKKFIKILEDAGYIRKKGSGWELTPRGTRKIGQRALGEIFSQMKKDTMGRHETHDSGQGGENSFITKPYEFGDPFHLDIQKTIMNSMQREGVGLPINLEPQDFEVQRTELLTQSATVIMLDLSWSMALRGSFQAAKKVALALHNLISSQYQRDSLYIVGFSAYARELKPEELPYVHLTSPSWARTCITRC